MKFSLECQPGTGRETVTVTGVEKPGQIVMMLPCGDKENA
jgi:hypothetical protein